jgi:DNA polymerase-3 subunit gamma/tau
MVPEMEPERTSAPPPPISGGDKASMIEELSASAVPFGPWPEVLQLLKESSRSVAAAFAGSQAYVNGDYLLIEASNSMAFELLRKDEQRRKMRDTIARVAGRDYKLGPYRTASQQQEQDDPLEALARQAEAAGISVIKT